MYVTFLQAEKHAFATRELAEAVAEQWHTEHPDHKKEIEDLRAEGLHHVADSKETRIEEWPQSKWEALLPGGHKAVWQDLPDRRLVHQALAAYNPDGTVGHEFQSSRPVWEFETDSYTTKDAEWRVEERPNGLTEAWARGTSKDAVNEAYLRAREEALRVCSRKR
ncbi:hypothetical protein [Streptomyces huasconensis]|uniref:hypothetical protein n=1 Tax=Streptomyces huasconensis TaxID=1854574 RepID=UPI0037029D25